MHIDQIRLLEKIIAIQSSIIEGGNIRSILHQESSFFLAESGADVIAVCLENEDGVEIELILEKRQHFLSLLNKYKLLPRHMELSKFIQQCNSHFSLSQEKVYLESLHAVFDGHLSKKKTAEFEEEIDFDHALLYPMCNKTGKKIGLIIYLFSKNGEGASDKLLQLTQMIEHVISPFYDEKRQTLHVKCIQIDEKMQRLTEKEKLITQRVLLAKPYKVIAEELNISMNTLKTHMKNIFSKYGVSSKIELHHKLTGNSL
ncbi:MAG: LuxR C-terminal-related transcriptional regulator [Campylobacterota bacterium]